MKVRMIADLSGYHDGVAYKGRGEFDDLDDAVAETLIKNGSAVEVKDDKASKYLESKAQDAKDASDEADKKADEAAKAQADANAKAVEAGVAAAAARDAANTHSAAVRNVDGLNSGLTKDSIQGAAPTDSNK